VWHDSCVRLYKPGIDQCNGEAALIQLCQGWINEAPSRAGFYNAYKSVEPDGNNQRPQK